MRHIARDTSDTEPFETDGEGIEYEPVTASEHEAPIEETSAASEDEIIKTEVIEVAIGDDGDLQLADSEFTDQNESDTVYRRHVYLRCAHCDGKNTNPVYRYCYKCFIMRKNFFPPRPRRNRKKSKGKSSASSTTTSVTCSIGGLSQGTDVGYYSGATALSGGSSQAEPRAALKRRASSDLSHSSKKPRCPSDSGTEVGTDTDDEPVQPLMKTVSDPLVSQIDRPIKLTKKTIANTLLEKMDAKDLCVVCVTEPKSGVFVHGRIAHICCCYRCAVKVWSTSRRCPVCNCRVSNVLRAVVM
ncbi:E3 ubiquitin-protein ligase Mdm2 isoform X2 [Manduca sexta]|uniref:E3 ubiquitin-protein ligase Mdm2 isoform X2 n=1 Tax=Manduca sexta TaxID=7130 RepID=UPI00188ED703|nr:E3 ubiquitin-protein ligase Mdm2 isoform X2 [Manduca sexta]XP_037296244.1 E3 ubiquitin-protein ligase Mdm2 isoform X2 [Manduca sexta]